MIHYILLNPHSLYMLHITHTVWAPAWRSLLWGLIYTNWQLKAHPHAHRTVVYYHCDLKQETLDQRMFFQQLPQSTALLFLKFNIRIRYRQPQAANTTSFFLVYGTTEREKNTFMRTSSSLTRPPVHKKVFQGQKGKVNVFKLHVKVNVRCFVVWSLVKTLELDTSQ